MGALGAGLEYLDGDAPEVGRARCGGEMEDLLELSGNVYMGAYVPTYSKSASLARKGATFASLPVIRLSMQTTL